MKHRRLLATAVSLVLLTLVFLLVTFLGWDAKPHRTQQLMLLVSALLTVFFAQSRLFSSDSTRWACLIVCIGIIMRIGYALYTPSILRNHDLGSVELGTSGHGGYILYIFTHGELPSSNDVQFGQPPLFHIIAAIFMRIYSQLSGITNQIELFEATRIVSCLSSCFTLMVCYQISTELKLNGSARLCFLSLCSFLPNYFLLSGRVNPDSLSVFFIYAIVLYTMRWYNQQTLSDTIRLALCFGFGLMTKMTVAVLAIPTGFIMLYIIWVKVFKNKEYVLIRNIVVFLIISVSFGMWYQVRNWVLFRQPLGYVYQLQSSNPLYIGHVSMWNRFGLAFSVDSIGSPYISNVTTDNIWVYLMKTAVFGEFSYNIGSLLPILLLFSFVLIAVISLVSIVFLGVKVIRQKMINGIYIGSVFISSFVAYIGFNMRYPFRCSMDFRYIVVFALIGAIAIGELIAYMDGRNRLIGFMRTAIIWLVVLMSACSVIMFTAI